MVKKRRILIAIIFITIAAVGVEAISFDKKKDFRFEDYTIAEEMQAALLELHPVGSEVEILLETLIKGEFKCLLKSSTNQSISKLNNKGDFAVCSYFKKGFLSNKEYRVVVDINESEPSKIKTLKVLLLNHLKFIP